MKKILLITQREYLSRVKKKSFLVLTFLVPTLFIAMYAAIFFIYKNSNQDVQNFIVLDESGEFQDYLKNTDDLIFTFTQGNYQELKAEIRELKDVFLLYIPKEYEQKGIELISEKKANFSVVGSLKSQLEEIIQHKKLLQSGIDPAVLKQSKAEISIATKQFTESGEADTSLEATYVIGFLAAFLIYLSLLIYGTQVMRGVIEEKTNRIVEVIVSSVKPFQLMMGKILGIGAVGLTQFLLWAILTSTLSVGLSSYFTKDVVTQTESIHQNNEIVSTADSPVNQFFKAADTIDFSYIMGTFVFYFLGGYLIYSALFAAVGSAVDNETETQQFIFPITLPLIFTFILGMNLIVNNPDSSLSFWLSVIPFTSPIAMMIRIPFGVPAWELALSMAMLLITFILTTWVASRIYRVGILMYGKKVSYRELIKWFMYKG